MLRSVVWICALVVMSLATGAAPAQQNFPAKAIRMVTAEIGGGADFTARLVALNLAVTVGRPVVVDNRGLTSMQIVANAPPDGYTLLTYGSPMWLAPLIHDAAWDPIKDFAPLTVATNAPNILVVHPGVPAKSVQELVALAKARPGQLNYGSGSPGSASHLGMELFKSLAAVDIVNVPYKGVGPALTNTIGGQVQVLLIHVAGGTPHISAGRLRALAVTSAKPTPLAPGLPTVAASGLPGFEVGTMIALFAPAGTPAALVRLLNQRLVQTLDNAEVREKLLATGVEVAPGPPGELTAIMKSDIARFGKVIKDGRLRSK